MPATLADKDWDILVRAIKSGRCTPFLGAGVNDGVLPLGRDIARRWAAQYDYPLKDSDNLIRVAQFLAVEYFPMFPKDEVVSLFQEINASPDFSDESEPHRVLAELPLPVYLTTNYDNFMMTALERKYRDPKREVCRWNTLTRKDPSRFDAGYEPSPANPVVFHIHGHVELPSSIVLTEDDYFDFLVNISSDPLLIPARIQKALTESSILFIGYGLADWNFRVLLQGLYRFMEKGLGRNHTAVMIPPDIPDSEAQQRKVQAYLAAYYQNIDVQIFWGTAREFCTELSKRWKSSL
jgi:hypothetical protein